jgi:hypothetical protein
MPNDYYSRVVKITEDYLGPASDRFIKRQLEFHLEGKDPHSLTKQDVMKLSEWVGTSLSLITQKKSDVHEVKTRIQKVAAM